MWLDVVTDLMNADRHKSRNGDSFEIIGWSGTLLDTQGSFLTVPGRAMSPTYAAAEFLWYLSAEEDVSLIANYAPSYRKYAEEGRWAYGAYGPRIQQVTVIDNGNVTRYNQLLESMLFLQKSPETRQCVVSIWRNSDLQVANRTPKKDMPCTLTWQFIVRNGRLNMVVNMRSNDVWLGMPYDIFVNTCFQRMLAAELGLGCGTYTHHVGSMHLYTKDYNNALNAVASPGRYLCHNWQDPSGINEMHNVLQHEKVARTSVGDPPPSPHGDMAKDLAECIFFHYPYHADHVNFKSDALQLGAKVYADHRRK